MTPVEQLVLNELRRVVLELMILAFFGGAAFSAVMFWLLRWMGY